MKEPFEPQRAIMRGLLVRWSSFLQDFPADSRMTDNSWRTTDCEDMGGEGERDLIKLDTAEAV